MKFRNLESELKTVMPEEDPDPIGFDHHLSHAAAAYFGWGKMDEKVLVLTCDGAGDCACATVSIGESGSANDSADRRKPLGRGIFWKITYLLGMVPMEDAV